VSREDEAVLALACSLEERGAGRAPLALVLGSGWGALAERLEERVTVPFEELDGIPRGAVSGHAGQIVAGRLGSAGLLVQQGRAHLYEGWTPNDVARSVRAFAKLGCRAVVLTNAAGGLREEWSLPALMRITDHVNLQGGTPLSNGEAGSARVYDEELGEAFDRAAREAGVVLERGVYAGLLGPSYETPAEIRMLDWMGADAVGMSTVCEAQAARAAGLRVVGVSCITNYAAGIAKRPLRHAEVLEAGGAAVASFARLLEQAVPRVLEVLGAS
jgi:purine-nucleoside phosphorylase